MSLDLAKLQDSIVALEVAISTIDRDGVREDKALFDTLKAGVIKNFEVAYEQSWKMMKRWLEDNVGREQMSGVTKKGLFRYACEYHLVTDFGKWVDYNNARNKTSHTYSQVVAEDLYFIARDFLVSSKELLKNIEARNE